MARIAFIYFFFFLFYFTTDNQFLSLEESSYQKLLLTKETHFDAIVALDGTGNYTKIMDAVRAVPNSSKKRFRIHIKEGVYYENVLIVEEKHNIEMIGDGIHATIISGNLSHVGNKLKTDHTATFSVKGMGFIARVSTHKNTITAHGGRGDQTITPYGFSFRFCKIYADSNILLVINSTQTFLGTPWKPYSTTVFMQSYISELLSPKGWLDWNGSTNLDTLYYAEYNNYGPGVGNRVKWGTYHVLTDTSQASNFTVAHFILGKQ